MQRIARRNTAYATAALARPRAGRLALAATAAAAALAVSAPPAPAQQAPQPPSAQRQQAQPAQPGQAQGQRAGGEPGAAARPSNAVSGANAQPNLLVLILPDVERRVRPVAVDDLYRGIRASRLMDQDVRGPNGNQLGEVQDVFVDTEGRVTRIVVEGGGFLDIGDAAFSVAWKDVDLTPGREGIRVPITESNAEAFGLFDGPETVSTGPREFRLSEVIGDYARLRNGAGYGRISDVVIGRDGRVLGVLVNRDYRWGGGLYAYPFYGYPSGFDPGADYYALPFGTPEEAARAPRVDSRRFEAGVL